MKKTKPTPNPPVKPTTPVKSCTGPIIKVTPGPVTISFD